MTDAIVPGIAIKGNRSNERIDIPVRSKPPMGVLNKILSAGTPEALQKYLIERDRILKEWREQRFCICALCRKTKKRTEFYSQSKYCNDCRKGYHEHKKRQRAVMHYKYQREGKGRTEWCAKQIVYNLKKMGLVLRKPCEVCGDEKTHAHHDDYTYPWIIRWLCHTHHVEWHKQHEPIYVE